MKIIGNMTGNSMDAIDLILTEFDGDKMSDICAYSKPYSKEMQDKMEELRGQVFNKTAQEICSLPNFQSLHDVYILQIAECIQEMCAQNKISKQEISAIGFHGKTLDHNPPSKASAEGTTPYTLQMGSGQMLADKTGIPVVYDFRSDYILNGCEGAPLVPPHNAHIAASEGDGIYYNGGNTSNFSLIINQKALLGTDSGPFNEYIDAYIRKQTSQPFDKDGAIGQSGKLEKKLLQDLFDFGRSYYETPLPKSGDPAYYHKAEILRFIEAAPYKFEDAVHTLEYFAAYIAAQALALVPKEIPLPNRIFLFGGGWKNPVVKQSFKALLQGEGFVLPEHAQLFDKLKGRFEEIKTSAFGEYMEARLMADMARYRLEERVWEIPEVMASGKKIISGCMAFPKKGRADYRDCLSRAAKGGQK